MDKLEGNECTFIYSVTKNKTGKTCEPVKSFLCEQFHVLALGRCMNFSFAAVIVASLVQMKLSCLFSCLWLIQTCFTAVSSDPVQERYLSSSQNLPKIFFFY